jgi:tetratricopeptide (TPR) repeat protein
VTMAMRRLARNIPELSRMMAKRQSNLVINSQPARYVTIYHSKDHKPRPPPAIGGGSAEGKKPPMEDEKYLADLQREVQQAHKEGDYEHALKLAVHAQKEMEDYFGIDHPVNASAWNNIAIMNKFLGNYNAGIDAYLKAISTYRSAAGEKHPQYVSTLSNLGLCFQAAALAKNKSMEKLPFLERALETFEEVLKLRKEVEISYSDNGGSHASTLAQAQHHYSLALFYLDNEKNVESKRKPHLFNLAKKEEIRNNAIQDTITYVAAVRERFSKHLHTITI